MTFLQLLLQIKTDSITNASEIIDNPDLTTKLIAIGIALVLGSVWIVLLIDKRSKNVTTEQQETSIPTNKVEIEKKKFGSDEPKQRKPTEKNITDRNTIINGHPESKDAKQNKNTIESVHNQPESNAPENPSKTPKPPVGKRINFEPTADFEQKEPIHFPIVCMPVRESRFTTPKPGRVGRKGYTEEHFQRQLQRLFSNKKFRIFSNQVLFGANKTVYTPDICLIYKSESKEIYFDIEIDEPYVGENDPKKRIPTHFSKSPKDKKRNKVFTTRGWIVIRFAEEQIHLHPTQCCLFISRVLKALDEFYDVPDELSKVSNIQLVKQWSEEEAEEMSRKKHRESYLKLISFGKTGEDSLEPIEQTEEEKEVENIISQEQDGDEWSEEKEEICPRVLEKEVTEKGDLDKSTVEVSQQKPDALPKDSVSGTPPTKTIDPASTNSINTIDGKIAFFEAMAKEKRRVSFTYRHRQDVQIENFKPSHCTRSNLSGYCLVQNRNIEYDLRFIKNIQMLSAE